jgi:hypothetical protein
MIFRRKKPQVGGANRPPMDKLDRPAIATSRALTAVIRPLAAEAPDGPQQAGARAFAGKASDAQAFRSAGEG